MHKWSNPLILKKTDSLYKLNPIHASFKVKADEWMNAIGCGLVLDIWDQSWPIRVHVCVDLQHQ